MINVVIVDDSGTARMMIRKCIEITAPVEVDVREASSGDEALKVMKEKVPDLLISDLNMPGMDGEKLLKFTKASLKLNEVPVIIISSAGNPKRKEELLSFGAETVLQKPITPPVLGEAINDLITNGVLNV